MNISEYKFYHVSSIGLNVESKKQVKEYKEAWEKQRELSITITPSPVSSEEATDAANKIFKELEDEVTGLIKKEIKKKSAFVIIDPKTKKKAIDEIASYIRWFSRLPNGKGNKIRSGFVKEVELTYLYFSFELFGHLYRVYKPRPFVDESIQKELTIRKKIVIVTVVFSDNQNFAISQNIEFVDPTKGSIKNSIDLIQGAVKKAISGNIGFVDRMLRYFRNMF